MGNDEAWSKHVKARRTQSDAGEIADSTIGYHAHRSQALEDTGQHVASVAASQAIWPSIFDNHNDWLWRRLNCLE